MAFNQPLAGLIEPAVPSWRTSSRADRLAFYKQAGILAIKEKRRELLIAIGANGRRMKDRKRPRPDGANGPVMDPHEELRRTYRLLASRDWADGVTLFWHAGANRKGQKKPWGTILGYHAEGRVKGAPVRDVRLSKRGIGVVRRAMATWWAKRIESDEQITKARDLAAKAAAAEAPSEPKPKKPGLGRSFLKPKTPKAPKHVPAPGSNRPLTPEQEKLAQRHPSLRQFLRNPEEDF